MLVSIVPVSVKLKALFEGISVKAFVGLKILSVVLEIITGSNTFEAPLLLLIFQIFSQPEKIASFIL